MAQVTLPVFEVSASEVANWTPEILKLQGYPSIWWRVPGGFAFWPAPMAKYPVLIVYDAKGEPVGWVTE